MSGKTIQVATHNQGKIAPFEQNAKLKLEKFVISHNYGSSKLFLLQHLAQQNDLLQYIHFVFLGRKLLDNSKTLVLKKAKLIGSIKYWCIMGDFVKKCCQCYWFSMCACNVASCIDHWHSVEACGLSTLYCNACCWTLCSPLCIDCKLGESGPAMENCTKGLKYCLFSCALCVASCVDGCYNCVKVIQLACGEGVKTYADLTKNAEFMGNKVKESLGLQTGNQPLRSMDTIKP